ncbi:hypothetical protein D3C71_1179700 [compost metagenome]
MKASHGAWLSATPWLLAAAKPGLSGLAMKRTRGSALAWRCTMSRVASVEPLSTTRISTTPRATRNRPRQASRVLALW